MTSDTIKHLYNTHRNFILYGIIGVSGALLDLVIFLILFNLLDISAVPATAISVLFGITNNFILNTIFNFKKTDRLFLRYISFMSIGVFGLLLSTLILALGEVFAVNANLSKVLSIPIIVLFQYFLNKRLSFHDFNPAFNVKDFVKHFWKLHGGILLINIIFVASCLFMIKSLPADGPSAGPDEVEHFRSNVQFIAENHRLPVSGIDDKAVLQICRENEYGAVPCRYSYVIYPAANYIVSATVGTALQDLSGISLLKGARIASMLWGILLINIIYLLSYRITKRRKVSWAIASIGLMPQVIFISSYINQDIHSLAISALCFYALVVLLQERRVSSVIFAGVCIGGLLPLAKYNFFILAPVLLAIILYFTLVARRLSYKMFAYLAISGVVSFISISLFWFLRNYILYNDFLGQSFVLEEMSKYATLGRVLPLNIETLSEYIRLGFFQHLFESFFLSLGYMTYRMPDTSYSLIQLTILMGVTYILYQIHRNYSHQRKKFVLIWLTFALTFVMSVFMVFYNSVVYDLQSQGRYLYPIILPLVIAVAASIHLDTRFRYLAYGIAGIVSYCYFQVIFIALAQYI